MITPLVGMVVHFRMRGSDPASAPLAATIAAVNSDGSLNIGYLNTDGQHRNAPHVILYQGSEPYPDTNETAFCEWIRAEIPDAAASKSYARDRAADDIREAKIDESHSDDGDEGTALEPTAEEPTEENTRPNPLDPIASVP